MAKPNVSLLDSRPLFDIASYPRRGPGRRDRLSPAELAQVSRTVRRVPETVVKVLPRDSNSFTSVRRHADYIGRYGDLELETDDGEQLNGKGAGCQLIEDWDLDLDEHRRQSDLAAASGRGAPKRVHKLMFSMPPDTPAQGVLAAARNFLRHEFAFKHRYAFVLHTDEPHPHVHAIVKAVSEQGIRLHIKKAALREWRREFARHLREQGIEANATERAVRGEGRAHKTDGIYRAGCRNVSTHMRERAEAVAAELLKGNVRVELGKFKLVQTRRDVERGWRSVTDILLAEGETELAAQVRRFAERMPPPRTEKELIAVGLMSRDPRSRNEGSTR